MLFNSSVFLQFFAAFLLCYWMVRTNLRARNILVLLASYLFYGWWDFRFLVLLLGSTLLDYFVGLALGRTAAPASRRGWLALSLCGNLGLLGVFKYYDFFVDSLALALGKLGWEAHLPTLNILLPVGISFYTFQTMSYAIDVYRGVLAPSRDWVAFASFVSFFPQLVAGPIERASHLLPQFSNSRTITTTDLAEGLWLLIWGMFKKVVLADNLAPLVTMVYHLEAPEASLCAPTVLLATLAFGLQIYCDFSGYSDIARGTARLLGFDIMVNFNLPYLATSLRDFWRRWHISLSTWLRDYLYISLGGNRGGRWRTSVNLFATLTLAGLWHGAAWHFILWGVFHGLGLAINHRFTAWFPPRPGPTPSRLRAGLAWFGTMAFVFYGWLLFRAESLAHISKLTQALAHWPAPSWLPSYLMNLAFFAAPLLAVEALQFKTSNPLAVLRFPTWIRAGLQAILLLAILLSWGEAGSGKKAAEFIYFQF